MEEYSEGTLPKVGLRKKDHFHIGEKLMIKLGYFLLIIVPNSNFSKLVNTLQLTIITNAYLTLEQIYGFMRVRTIEVIMDQI
jgi:hypothetical protein